jgi:hypothetical protein
MNSALKCAYRKIYSVGFIFSFVNIKKQVCLHLYYYIILKLSGDTAVEPARTTNWLLCSPDLDPLYCYVRKERVHEKKPERTVSALKSCCKKELKAVWQYPVSH